MPAALNTCEQGTCREDLFSEETDLKRDLGLLEATSVVIGRIIGSGIFRTPAPIMVAVGCTSLFGLVWVLGGLVTIFGAVCYAELAAMMPRTGGEYVYLKAAYGPLWAFLRGWATFFVSETGAIAAVALVFAEYLNALVMIVTGSAFSPLYHVLIALSALWILTAVNCFGVFLSGQVQNFFSSIKILAIGAIIGISFAAGGDSSNFVTPLWPETLDGDTLNGVGRALRYAFFAFSGWQGATFIAGEVKNPRRNLPLSLFLGIAGVSLLYAGANAAYLYQLSPAVLAKSPWVATAAMKVAMGSAGGILIAATVMTNTFGNVSTQILCKARTWQAMAADGLFFRGIDRLHPRFKTPNNALILQAAWASVLLLAAGFHKQAYERIIDFFSATGALFTIMILVAVIILRRRYPEVHRPYRAWLYPWSVIGVTLLYIAYLVLTLKTAFLPSLAGLGLTATGLFYYYGVVKRRNIK